MSGLFCKKCDHYAKPDEIDDAICTNPDLQTEDLVEGTAITLFCSEARKSGQRCGPNGMFHTTKGEPTSGMEF